MRKNKTDKGESTKRREFYRHGKRQESHVQADVMPGASRLPPLLGVAGSWKDVDLTNKGGDSYYEGNVSQEMWRHLT